MSRFDELCAALGVVRAEYQAYRKECYLFVGKFNQNFAEYLGAPDGNVSLFAKFGSFAGRKVDGPAAALHLHDDAWWHFGIALDLIEEEGNLAYHTIGFDFKLQHTAAGFELHINDAAQFVIERAEPELMLPAFEWMFNFLKARYHTSFQEFLAGDGTRRFGF